ncbi:MAG: hypothetical protein A3J40_01560 [Erythrobacter sp. RIFCSPHIGHO2_12_FULL_63_10]|nr:MAG: hypothetical protein A3J40_01560 [Erythrobacter sp. RIFCSPHIGHO2_12_FULL_63_10]
MTLALCALDRDQDFIRIVRMYARATAAVFAGRRRAIPLAYLTGHHAPRRMQFGLRAEKIKLSSRGAAILVPTE